MNIPSYGPKKPPPPPTPYRVLWLLVRAFALGLAMAAVWLVGAALVEQFWTQLIRTP